MNFSKRFKTVVCTLQITFLCSYTFSQENLPGSSIHQKVAQHTNKIFDDLVTIRRDFHRYPEISGQEKRTSKKITSYLKSLGLEVKTNVGGYGVVGILKGSGNGKSIAWRADIDAMPSDIPDVVAFQSKNQGVRHICGHDVNTAIGLGIANVMASQKENLKGTLYFIFQPAEETYTGAKAMIDDGLFDYIDPDEIYAAHVAPLPKGMIATRPEWLFADYRSVEVSYRNSGNNEALIAYTKQLLSDLQSVKDDSPFFDPRSQLDPTIGLANPNTIFKDFITVQKDFHIEENDGAIHIIIRISASDTEGMNSIIPQLKEKINTSEYVERFIDVKLKQERANLTNDKALTLNAMKTIGTIYGQENVVRLYGAISDNRGDDFAYFQKQVAGVYFLLGGSNYQTGVISTPHAPNFQVDEECIKTGVNYFSSLILERLND
ncbi:amidohydrolase [Flavobacteriaceae bacterium TP-CH-4]|uniref:Amidohydrolase n=1 Tax=Pelagihabitans pacificus TaxID=2696054 RepID=A0A967AVA7_9FLAO|nr:M20/M25/M40 family metallo-hydrolase [Pelagihabitans pacificus]NHF60878.1 amidohydrolase [Pelagihabitans pacificus]